MRAGLVGSWRAHERIPPEGPVMQVTRGLLAGGIFFAIGASATFIASDYRMGTIVRMGPGFFPVAIGCVIALIGALIIVQELLTGNKTDPVELVHLRPLVVITLAVMAFGRSGERRGGKEWDSKVNIRWS